MGEVYRARDTCLGREVAIKILPERLMRDAERSSRFEREARLLATLNHPHIGTIYGLEEIDNGVALVLELVEGPTLADRLARGPLAVADALTIGRQITEALDAAHAKGIVHRDLKPANVVLQDAGPGGRVTSETRVKILDFGLARPSEGAVESDVTDSNRSFDRTADGRILGTPAYMSPEQARGLAVDKRTDIWAFGCVLFEMLSGTRAFSGDTMTDTLAHVLERDPDWRTLPRGTPPSVIKLLRRCLQKDPVRRTRDIGDARAELDDALSDPAPAAPARRRISGPAAVAASRSSASASSRRSGSSAAGRRLRRTRSRAHYSRVSRIRKVPSAAPRSRRTAGSSRSDRTKTARSTCGWGKSEPAAPPT